MATRGRGTSTAHAAVIAAARSSVLLANLTSDALERTLDEASYTELAPQTTLLHEGSDRIVLLISGSAKRWTVSSRGDRVVTQLLGPGQAVGMIGVLGYPGVAGTIDTLERTAILAIPGAHARTLVDAAPSFARACLRTLAAELADVRIEQSRLSGGSARDRIVERLLHLGEQFGVPQSDHVRIDLPLTQEDLASWAGVSRESAARVLHDLRSRGVVRTGRRQISIEDVEALESLREGRGTRVTSQELIASLRQLSRT